jgi:hypothetical protein
MTKKPRRLGDIELSNNNGYISWDVYMGKGEGFEVNRESSEQAIAEILSRVLKIEAKLNKRRRR